MEHPGQVIEGHTVIRSSEVKIGDRITETTTPEGPFYAVVRETAKSFWVDCGEGIDPLRCGKSPRSILLRHA